MDKMHSGRSIAKSKLSTKIDSGLNPGNISARIPTKLNKNESVSISGKYQLKYNNGPLHSKNKSEANFIAQSSLAITKQEVEGTKNSESNKNSNQEILRKKCNEVIRKKLSKPVLSIKGLENKENINENKPQNKKAYNIHSLNEGKNIKNNIHIKKNSSNQILVSMPQSPVKNHSRLFYLKEIKNDEKINKKNQNSRSSSHLTLDKGKLKHGILNHTKRLLSNLNFNVGSKLNKANFVPCNLNSKKVIGNNNDVRSSSKDDKNKLNLQKYSKVNNLDSNQDGQKNLRKILIFPTIDHSNLSKIVKESSTCVSSPCFHKIKITNKLNHILSTTKIVNEQSIINRII